MVNAFRDRIERSPAPTYLRTLTGQSLVRPLTRTENFDEGFSRAGFETGFGFTAIAAPLGAFFKGRPIVQIGPALGRRGVSFHAAARTENYMRHALHMIVAFWNRATEYMIVRVVIALIVLALLGVALVLGPKL